MGARVERGVGDALMFPIVEREERKIMTRKSALRVLCYYRASESELKEGRTHLRIKNKARWLHYG